MLKAFSWRNDEVQMRSWEIFIINCFLCLILTNANLDMIHTHERIVVNLTLNRRRDEYWKKGLILTFSWLCRGRCTTL